MKEFTPVFTERATNIFLPEFRNTMREISKNLKHLYNAHSCIILPGSGSFGMEAAARQFADDKKCLIVSNGFFGNRWKLTLEQGNITNSITIIKADKKAESYQPLEIKKLIERIRLERPEVIFLTHVETSTGIFLPDDYVRTIAAAARSLDCLVVVDAIASGMLWLDMESLGIDVLITAPQKGLSAHACCGIVLLNEKTRSDIENTGSTSLVMDLRKWLEVMENFEGGGFYYHATLPSDSLNVLKSSLQEITEFGKEKSCDTQQKLGNEVRKLLETKGLVSAAADGFQSSSIVVYYNSDSQRDVVEEFKKLGFMVGGPLPFMLEDEQKPNTFRIGLLGIEKIRNAEQTVSLLKSVIEIIFTQNGSPGHF